MSTTDRVPDDGRPRKRRPLGQLVRILLMAFVVHTFVFPQLGGARAALSTISSVSIPLVVVALGLEIAAIVMYGRLSLILLPPEPKLSLSFTSAVALASIGVNHVVPGGAATTAAVNYRLFGRAGVARSDLVFALGTQAIGSAVVLNVILWAALLISIPVSGFHLIYATAAGFGAVLMAVFAGALYALTHGRDGVAHHAARLIGRLPRVRPESVERSIRQIGLRVDSLARQPALVRQGLVAASLNWLLDAAALWTMLAAFGHRPSVVGVLVSYGLANVLGAIPITPGGLGVIEAVLLPSLVGFGTPAPVAAVGVVAYRLVNFWLPIPTGLATYAVLQRRRGGDEPHPVRRLLDTLLERVGDDTEPD